MAVKRLAVLGPIDGASSTGEAWLRLEVCVALAVGAGACIGVAGGRTASSETAGMGLRGNFAAVRVIGGTANDGSTRAFAGLLLGFALAFLVMRAGLKAAACSCYAVDCKTYSDLLG